MSVASRLSTSDQLMAPAFFTKAPDAGFSIGVYNTLRPLIGPKVPVEFPGMKRGGFAAVFGAILLGGGVFTWNAVHQEREFRRLIVAGDAALARDRTYDAIEAFSGALALKHDSMLAYLKRGDSYRRRGELSAALRDLRDASSLDPAATRPLELLGDVNVAMGRYERAADAYRRYVALDDRAPRVLYKLPPPPPPPPPPPGPRGRPPRAGAPA